MYIFNTKCFQNWGEEVVHSMSGRCSRARGTCLQNPRGDWVWALGNTAVLLRSLFRIFVFSMYCLSFLSSSEERKKWNYRARKKFFFCWRGLWGHVFPSGLLCLSYGGTWPVRLVSWVGHFLMCSQRHSAATVFRVSLTPFPGMVCNLRRNPTARWVSSLVRCSWCLWVSFGLWEKRGLASGRGQRIDGTQENGDKVGREMAVSG